MRCTSLLMLAFSLALPLSPSPQIPLTRVWVIGLQAPNSVPSLRNFKDDLPYAEKLEGRDFIQKLKQKNPGWEIHLLAAVSVTSNGPASFQSSEASVDLLPKAGGKLTLTVNVYPNTPHNPRSSGPGMSRDDLASLPVGKILRLADLTDQNSPYVFSVFAAR